MTDGCRPNVMQRRPGGKKPSMPKKVVKPKTKKTGKK